MFSIRYDTDGNGFVDYREFISKLGVEFSPGDLHGHSTRIIKESYDTMKPDFRNEVRGFSNSVIKATAPYHKETDILTNIQTNILTKILTDRHIDKHTDRLSKGRQRWMDAR